MEGTQEKFKTMKQYVEAHRQYSGRYKTEETMNAVKLQNELRLMRYGTLSISSKANHRDPRVMSNVKISNWPPEGYLMTPSLIPTNDLADGFLEQERRRLFTEDEKEKEEFYDHLPEFVFDTKERKDNAVNWIYGKTGTVEKTTKSVIRPQ